MLKKHLVLMGILIVVLIAPLLNIYVAENELYDLKVSVSNEGTFALFINNSFRGIHDTETTLKLRKGTYKVSVIGLGTRWFNKTIILNNNTEIKVKLEPSYDYVTLILRDFPELNSSRIGIIVDGKLMKTLTTLKNNSKIAYLSDGLHIIGIAFKDRLLYKKVYVGPRRGNYLELSMRELGVGCLRVRLNERGIGNRTYLVINNVSYFLIKGRSITITLTEGHYAIRLYKVSRTMTYVSRPMDIGVRAGEVTEILNPRFRPAIAYGARLVLSVRSSDEGRSNLVNIVGLPVWGVKGLRNKYALILNNRFSGIINSYRGTINTYVGKVELSNLSIGLLNQLYEGSNRNYSISSKGILSTIYVSNTKLMKIVVANVSKRLGSNVYLIVDGKLVDRIPSYILEKGLLYLPRNTESFTLIYQHGYTCKYAKIDISTVVGGGVTTYSVNECVSSSNPGLSKAISVRLGGVSARSIYDLRVVILANGIPTTYTSMGIVKDALIIDGILTSPNTSRLNILIRNVRTGDYYTATLQPVTTLKTVKARAHTGSIVLTINAPKVRYAPLSLSLWVDNYLVFLDKVNIRNGLYKLLLRGVKAGSHTVRALVRVVIKSRAYIGEYNFKVHVRPLTESNVGIDITKLRAETSTLTISSNVVSGEALAISVKGDVRKFHVTFTRVIKDLLRGDKVSIIFKNVEVMSNMEIHNTVKTVQVSFNKLTINSITIDREDVELNLRPHYKYLLLPSPGNSYEVEYLALHNNGTKVLEAGIAERVHIGRASYFIIPFKTLRNVKVLLKLIFRSPIHLKYGNHYYIVINEEPKEPVYEVRDSELKTPIGYIYLKPLNYLTGTPAYLEYFAIFINGSLKHFDSLLPGTKEYMKVSILIGHTSRITLYSKSYSVKTMYVKPSSNGEVYSPKLLIKEDRMHVHTAEVRENGIKFIKIVLKAGEARPLKQYLPDTLQAVIGNEVFKLRKESDNSWTALIPKEILGNGTKSLVVYVGSHIIYSGNLTILPEPTLSIKLEKNVGFVNRSVRISAECNIPSHVENAYIALRYVKELPANETKIISYIRCDGSNISKVIKWIPKSQGFYTLVADLVVLGEVARTVSKPILVVPRSDTSFLLFIPQVINGEVRIVGAAFIPQLNKFKVRVYINGSLINEFLTTSGIFIQPLQLSRNLSYVVRIECTNLNNDIYISSEAVINIK